MTVKEPRLKFRSASGLDWYLSVLSQSSQKTSRDSHGCLVTQNDDEFTKNVSNINQLSSDKPVSLVFLKHPSDEDKLIFSSGGSGKVYSSHCYIDCFNKWSSVYQ